MIPAKNGSRVVVLVKAPRPGFVKTRLADTIGSEAAAEAYSALVESLLTRLSRVSGVELKFTPTDARDEIQAWLQPGWPATPQRDGDLSDRLIGAFADAFQAGTSRVVVIGSDCPYVSPEDLDSALHQLETHDVVIGPATDGGYWLIGLKEPHESLFHDIRWSTESVLTETLDIAKREGLSVFQLRSLSDIDTVKDLIQFQAWSQTNPVP